MKFERKCRKLQQMKPWLNQFRDTEIGYTSKQLEPQKENRNLKKKIAKNFKKLQNKYKKIEKKEDFF